VIGAPNPPDNRVETDRKAAIGGPADRQTLLRKKLASIPQRQRGIFLRAWSGKSRKAAMRAFCLECMGYEPAEVGRCTAPACPLYPYREGRT
jgi:hypothetical protein